MSIEYHWTCDGCGRREISRKDGLPPGWIVAREGGISHRCSDCAPPVAAPDFPRRFWAWCRWHPAFAAMMFSNILLLVIFTLGSAMVAWHVRKVQYQLKEELARAHRTLHDQGPAPSRP